MIASLVPVLADEMTRASNLTVSADDDKLVLLRRDEEPPPRPVLSPLGVVTWSQNRMPLGLEIDTFEDGKLAKAQRVEVHASVPTDAVPRLVQPRDVRRARGVGGAGAAGVRAPAGGRDREAAGGSAGDPDDGARELRGDQVAVPHPAHRRRTR